MIEVYLEGLSSHTWEHCTPKRDSLASQLCRTCLHALEPYTFLYTKNLRYHGPCTGQPATTTYRQREWGKDTVQGDGNISPLLKSVTLQHLQKYKVTASKPPSFIMLNSSWRCFLQVTTTICSCATGSPGSPSFWRVHGPPSSQQRKRW